MGLFDGPVMSFAEKFCRFLDGRSAQLYAQAVKAKEEQDSWEAMRTTILADALHEISIALKVVAGIE